MKNIYLILIVICLQSAVFSQTHMDSVMFKIGSSIESSFYTSDTAIFNNLFDYETFCKNIITEDTSNHDLRIFNNGFKQELYNKFALTLLNMIDEDDYYNFINYSDDEEGNYYLRFRLFSEEGLNYHEYYIPFSENKEHKITDVFIYTTGEYFSETFNRIYNYSSKSVISKEKSHSDSIFLQSIFMLNMVSQLREQGKIKEAASLLNRIPDSEFKNGKTYLTYKLSLTDINDSESYMQIMEEYMHKYPENPTIYLLGIDYFILSEKYGRAHDMINKLYEMTEDDFLDFYHGSICNESGNYKSAESYLKKLLIAYPYLFEGYELMMTVQIKQKKYDESVLLLDKIIEYFEINKVEVSDMIQEFYPKFYKTKDFKNWKKANQ